MDVPYIVSETKPENLEFYLSCFSNDNFCENYGITIPPGQLIPIVRDISLTPYENVSRYVLYYKEYPIFFCHFLLKDKSANVSGGILPKFINSGKGVFAAAILFDQYIKYHQLKKLIIKVEKENTRSLKIHKAFGFFELSKTDKVEFQLETNNFPNSFVEQILNRIKYEIR